MSYRKLQPDEIEYRFSEEYIKSLDIETENGSIIGQPRALQALKMGVEIPGKGYNLFVSGPSGSGRRTAVERILAESAVSQSDMPDIVYRYNFKNPARPKALYLPMGTGYSFKNMLHQMVENLKDKIKQCFEKDSYKAARDEMVSYLETEENRRIQEFEEKLKRNGFRIMQVDDAEERASDIVPLYEGRQTDFESLYALVQEGKLSEEEWNSKREQYYHYMDEMQSLFHDLKKNRHEFELEMGKLQKKTVLPVIKAESAIIREVFTQKDVKEYLNELEEDVSERLYLFLQDGQGKDEYGNPGLIRYGVNVLVFNEKESDVPVIFEHAPNYENLFGTIETRADSEGSMRSNFMMIKPGSLMLASGGYLVMYAEDIFNDEEVWNILKRSLLNGTVEIQPRANIIMPAGPRMKPEPVHISLKVILIGGEYYYDMLYQMDEEFAKLFKVPAEFDSVMDNVDENIKEYVRFIKRRLKPGDKKAHADKTSAGKVVADITPKGIAAVLHYGIRLAEHRKKLSTKFSHIADIIIESKYWAAKATRTRIEANDVEKAISMRKFFYNLPEEKTAEMMELGELVIPLKGSCVGRVNGLVIHDRGYYSFGMPAQISASVSPGHEGVLNIEKEAGLSGEIHTKGVMILDGFLRSRYAIQIPLSIAASICIEQNYAEVDGDSASATEILALLSAIADIPLRQDIAVTGAVTQRGEVQAVGGISEKVEGFYQVCKRLGYTGGQGVIIPEQNIDGLIVTSELRDEIRNGGFSVFPISTINEGLEILSGMPAGERTAKGGFKDRSFNYFVEKRLNEFAKRVKDFGGN